jgi:hypothetical protein
MKLNDALILAAKKYGYPGYVDLDGHFRLSRGGYGKRKRTGNQGSLPSGE